MRTKRSAHQLILLIVFLFLYSLAKSQSPGLSWATTFSSATAKRPYDIKVDDSGNVYTTGYFYGTVDFDPGTGVSNLTANGSSEDVFITKQDPSGNLLWAKQVGGTNGDAGKVISIDGNGNVIVTGYFLGTVDFDPGSGVFNMSGSGSNSNFFVLKLNSDGDFIWAKSIRNSSFDFVLADAMITDVAANIFIGGNFRSTVDFDPGAGAFDMTASVPDMFVMKLDLNGDLVWAKKANGNSGSATQVNGITLDASGHVLLSGQFSGVVNFDPYFGPSIMTSAGNDDAFVIKLDADGDYILAKQVGGTGADQAKKVHTDASLNIYLTGYFAAAADFDPGSAVFTITPSSNSDYFIVKLKPDGDFIWANSISDLSDNDVNTSAIDNSGNIYTSGFYNSSLDLDPGSGTFNLTSPSGFISNFVSKLDDAGNFVWAVASAQGGSSLIRAFTLDIAKNIYVLGDLNGTSDFEPEVCVTNRTSVNGFQPDIFIQKLSDSATPSCSSLSITSFTPTSGSVGTSVEIIGTNFSMVPADNTVLFNGTAATVIESTSTSIKTTVPAGATTGTISVTVSGNTATSSSVFTVTAPSTLPTITGFTPSSGLVGTSVTISGTNFSTTSSDNEVRFNGTLAAIASSTSTSINTTVPAGATTGTISVTVAGNTATSSSVFTVIVLPPGGSFSPTNGPVGTLVTFTGMLFPLGADTEVRFNGTLSTSINVTSSSSVEAIVPAGATTGSVSVTSGGFTAFTIIPFTVTAPSSPTITGFTPASGPAGTQVTISGTNFSITPANNEVRFNGTLATVSSSTSTSITTTVPSSATTGKITVSVAGNTATSTSDFVVVSVISISTQPVSGAVCAGKTISFSVVASGASNLNYQWQKSTGNFTNLANNAVYSGTTSSVLTINASASEAGDYRCVVSGDNASDVNSTTATLTVNAVPSAPAVTGASGCAPSASVTLTATGGSNGQYRWYTVASGGTPLQGEVNSSYKTPALSATTNYFVAVNTSGCESARTQVTATITTCNQAPVIAASSATVQIEGEATFDLLKMINDPDNNLDPSSFSIAKQPISGAPASINNSVLRVNYSGISFSGRDVLSVSACDLDGSCAEQQITIDVAGDVVVYNAVSPNGDSKNDYLFLQYIDVLADTKQNHVSIFNRWGDLVFDVHDYNNRDNVFVGLNNQGKELATGTYYYKIQFASGRESKTGYLYIRN